MFESTIKYFYSLKSVEAAGRRYNGAFFFNVKSWDKSQVQSVNLRAKSTSACGSQINMFGQNIWPKNLSVRRTQWTRRECSYPPRAHRWSRPRVWEKLSQKREQSRSAFALGGWAGASGRSSADGTNVPTEGKCLHQAEAFQVNPGRVVNINSGEVRVGKLN